MTSKDYKNLILEQLDELSILARPMMGGYLFYYNSILFGGIYTNNNFLIKKTKSNERFHLKEEIPYNGGKPMYLIEDLDDIDFLKEVVLETCQDLKK